MPTLKLSNLFRRAPAAPSLRERAASLRAAVSPRTDGPGSLPAPGSEEAKAAFAAACREHSVRTNPPEGWPGLARDDGRAWTRHDLGRAMDVGEITPAEYARLYPLASERELQIETVGHELNLGSLFALAYADEYPLPAGVIGNDQSGEDDELLALRQGWEAAAAAYAQAIRDQITISDMASTIETPPPREPHEQWAKLVPGWRERTGVEAAEAASSDAMDDLCEIEDRISNLPATTLAGLKLKALVAQRNEVSWPDGLDESLVSDILAIGEPAVEADADLLQLGRQFEAARKREIAAGEACNAVQREAARHMPGRPDCLILRLEDEPFNLAPWSSGRTGEQVFPRDIDHLRRHKFKREIWRTAREGETAWPGHNGKLPEVMPWPEAQARADEIVAAWDDWHAAKATVDLKHNRPDLEEEADEAGTVAANLAQAIARLPARTAAGFRVKLRALESYNPRTLLNDRDLPDEPDPDQMLSHSIWRDTQGEFTPAIEPTGRNSLPHSFTTHPEPSPVFVSIADATRAAAADALADTRVSTDLRAAVEAHRDATVAMLLEPDESNEASDARCGVVEQTGAALRAVPARSISDVRCKLAFLLPEILPDVNGSVPSAFLENIREDVDRLAQQPMPAPIGTSLIGQIDFASGSMEDLRSLRDIANSVGDVAYAMAWTGRCHTRAWDDQDLPGEQHNAAGKLMQWLGEALADVADEARKEAQRRRPETPSERETRLTILAGPTIENGDPDEIAAFVSEMGAHAMAELAGH